MKFLIAFFLLLPLAGHGRLDTGRVYSPHNVAGSWNGTLFIDSVGHVPRRPVATNIRVRITLAPAPIAGKSSMQIAKPTHVGTAQGNFQGLNTGLTKSSYPLQAVQKADDTLLVAINPMFDHGAIVLRGKFNSVSYRGTWVVTDYAKGLSGHFELKRLAKR